MSNGTPCSSQLIWCEGRIAELEQQLAAKIDRNGVLYIRLAESQAREKARCETGNQYVIDNARLTEQLAAAQAREKVLHSLSNELLHQIDINDFTDSHGHSAKMLKAFHDLMKYNTQPADDTALKAAIQHGITEFLERTGQYVTNDASRKAALRAERERIASLILDIDTGAMDAYQVSEAIRALDDE